MKRFPALAAASLVALELAACGRGATEKPMTQADLILVHGKVHTLDPGIPEAAAVAIAGDRILSVGTDAEVAERNGPGTRKVDLKGRCVLPGLIDAHLHLEAIGEALEVLDLRGVTSAEEAARRVAESAARTAPAAWILGLGWDQNLWPGAGFPTAAILDAVSGDHPVALTRVDGHALWVNQAALDATGIGRATSNPVGGKILRDPTGKPTGVLLDDAMELIQSKIPPAGWETKQRRIEQAGTRLLAAGVTSVHDAGVDPEDIDLYKRMVEARSLPLRVYAMLGDSNRKLPDYFKIDPVIGYGDRRFTFRALKLGLDGALGSRGAALLAPYSDDPKNSGINTTAGTEIERITREALSRGLQVCVHAIGDRANRMALDAFEHALAAVPAKDPRLRIEHAQIVDPSDIPRFGRLGILASMQPIHATSDMPWVPARLGETRLAGAYPWRLVLNSQGRLAFGSDAPVDSLSPLDGLFAAVTRQDHQLQPEGGWLPEQRLTREEALRAYTLGAAYAAFEEDQKGSLTPGKLADLVVLDRDYFEVPEAEIFQLKVEMTILGGKIVYERPAETAN